MMAGEKKYEQALPVGFVLNGGANTYVVEQVLGQGGFGITYKVKARIKAGNITISTHFAIKEFFPSNCWRNEGSTQMLFSPTTKQDVEASLKDFVAEGRRLQRICSMNNNIVRVNEVFEANSTAYFVMEYLAGGDLRKMVREKGGRLSESEMMSVISPIAEALQCLHDNKMLHLDIKPENIVMRQSDDGSPDVPVLIDFGIAVHFDENGAPTTTRPTKGVTQGYSPPEQFAGINRFDPRIDIYALSATCYYLLTGKDPKGWFELNTAELSRDLAGKASQSTITNIIKGMSKEMGQRHNSVAQFMQEFSDNESLAPGTEIKGMYQNYIILSVVDRTPEYVRYKATLNDKQSDSNATRAINHNSSKSNFWVWEQLGSAWSIPEQKGYINGDFGGMSDEQQAVVSEYFTSGKTQYVIVREDYAGLSESVEQSRPEPEPVVEQFSSQRDDFTPKTHTRYMGSTSVSIKEQKVKKSRKPLFVILAVVVALVVLGLAVVLSLGSAGGGPSRSGPTPDEYVGSSSAENGSSVATEEVAASAAEDDGYYGSIPDETPTQDYPNDAAVSESPAEPAK